ncbi:hypothetical protein M2337_002468 [Sphingobium sp. B2D3A]|uniref:M17 family peptidase N-terminal domain-containing protein n=1 Tax=unclassified Sphingobium TaxID=2611147 RepID=UPI0022241D88|nr:MULTISPECIES: M17 family peptidase N-terminal domain-containing protein [unclassified Sphingobium]MCW2338235.1 hypothetical protein [Sphingobium sp. B2D3A]MCW2384693.1 hypothetical protein [Sphingobium sp. B2D3D]
MRKSVGQYLGVSVQVAAWDGVAATVDLSCACMFTREARGEQPVGGLAHLDAALDGGLTRSRESRVFRATRGEVLLIDSPPPIVEAAAVLVIGLGDPGDWSTDIMADAVSTAFATAVVKRATSVAFAPSMLDGGLSGAQTSGAAEKMMQGLKQAIAKQCWLHDEGLAAESSVREWVFDVGAERFEAAEVTFGEALKADEPA